jgi:hypothetical protein
MNRMPIIALIFAVAVVIAALVGYNLAPRGASAAGPQGSPAASQPQARHRARSRMSVR